MPLAILQESLAADLMNLKPDRNSNSCYLLEQVRAEYGLSAAERLDIYRRSYRERLLDSLKDDFPLLEGHLGESAFESMANAYLSDFPSTSFTLRDLGMNLGKWIKEAGEQFNDGKELLAEIFEFEWAIVEAFDAPSALPLSVTVLSDPEALLRVSVQPNVRLVKLNYYVPDFAVAKHATPFLPKEPPKLGGQVRKGCAVYVVIYRHNHDVEHLQVNEFQFGLLSYLKEGVRIDRALSELADIYEINSNEVNEAFQIFAVNGWLCLLPEIEE